MGLFCQTKSSYLCKLNTRTDMANFRTYCISNRIEVRDFNYNDGTVVVYATTDEKESLLFFCQHIYNLY